MKYSVTDIYKNEVVLSDATYKDVRDFFGRPKLCVTKLVYSKKPYLKKYVVECTEYNEEKGRSEFVNRNLIPDNFVSEWAKINKQFGKVDWVKKDEWTPDVKTLEL